MRVADVLRELGRPIAYYPFLARYLGGVNAAVLFCQIFYWQDKATSELGVHKTSAELENETGLSYEEQRSARAALRDSGVLIETEKRIEHKIYFRVDEDALERILSAGPAAKKPRKTRAPKSKTSLTPPGKSPLPEMGKVHFGELEKSIPGNGESPVPGMEEVQSPNLENPSPPTGQNLVRGTGEVQVVNDGVTTAETTAAATRASNAVDNSEQLPPLPREDENCNDAAPPERDASAKAEAAIVELLQSLETARGKTPAFDGSKARIHVLAWIGRCVTLEQLRTAHGFAVAARLRDKSDLPVNAGFLATFVDELLVGKSSVMPDALPWYRSDERVAIRAREIGFRDRKPNESPAWYRVLVIKAANDRKAAEFVLLDAKQFNALDLYQFARATFGDALMPVDDYAS